MRRRQTFIALRHGQPVNAPVKLSRREVRPLAADLRGLCEEVLLRCVVRPVSPNLRPAVEIMPVPFATLTVFFDCRITISSSRVAHLRVCVSVTLIY